MGFDIGAKWAGLGDRTQASVLDGAFRLGGGILSGMGAGKQNDALLAANKERDQVDALIRMLGLNQNQDQFEETSKRLGMQSAGAQLGGPLDIQADRQKMALNRAFLFDGKDGGPQYSLPGPQSTIGGFVGNLPRFDSAKPFYSDSAMMNAELPFWQTIGQQTGGQVGPNFQNSGYQGGGAAQGSIDGYNKGVQQDQAAAQASSRGRMDQTQAAIQQALSSSAAGAAGAGSEREKKPGFWNKLGRVAAFAAPVIAAPFTGGASLALIGAGAGAAGAALNGGGVGGAIKGGLLGAGTSMIGGALSGGGSPTMSNALGKAFPNMSAPAGQLMYGAGQKATGGIMPGLARGVGKVRF